MTRFPTKKRQTVSLFLNFVLLCLAPFNGCYTCDVKQIDFIYRVYAYRAIRRPTGVHYYDGAFFNKKRAFKSIAEN